MKKRFIIPALALAATAVLAGCNDTDATVVTDGMVKDAENFKIDRRVTAINLYDNSVLFTVEGKCSITDQGNQLEVLCKVSEGNDPNNYTRTLVGIPKEGVTYVAEQTNPTPSDPYHYQLNLKPETVIPDINLRTSAGNVG